MTSSRTRHPQPPVGYTTRALAIKAGRQPGIFHTSLIYNHATRTIPSALRLGQRIRPDLGPSILRTSYSSRLPSYQMLIPVLLGRSTPRLIRLGASGRILMRTKSSSRRTQMFERSSAPEASGVRNQTSTRLLSRKANDVIHMVDHPLRVSPKLPAYLPSIRTNARIVGSWESSKTKLLEPKRSARRRRGGGKKR